MHFFLLAYLHERTRDVNAVHSTCHPVWRGAGAILPVLAGGGVGESKV
jgi:hypothetical protein